MKYTIVINGRNFDVTITKAGKHILHAVDNKPITDNDFKKFAKLQIERG